MNESTNAAELLPAEHDNSWPLLETSLAGADKLPSSKLGRWLKSVVVRLALLWLSFSIGLVVLHMAKDAMVKSLRRGSEGIVAAQGEEA